MSTLVHHGHSQYRPYHSTLTSHQHPTNNNNKIYNNASTPISSHAAIQNWVTYSTPLTPTQSDYDFSNDTSYVQSEQRPVYDFSASEQQQNSNNLQIQVQTPFGSSSDSKELMNSDHSVAPNSWNFPGQLTPTSARSHYRESSLSSLGSAGPASPYTSSTSHPHVILQPDSVSEQYYDGLPIVDPNTYQTFSKPLTPRTPSHDNNFLASSFHAYPTHYHHNSDYAHLMAMQKLRSSVGDDESMPAPEYGHSGRPSVASTHESPATPAAGEDNNEQSGKTDFRSASSVPKLDRTMSDAYNDELYNPNIVYAPQSTKSKDIMASHSPSDVFAQRLQAANSQHLSASTQLPSIDASRRSPFRQGSPLAPTSNSFGSSIGTAAKLREAQKAQNDVRMYVQHLHKNSPSQSTPKTISPKDALLEYHETEEDSSMPLFPPQKTSQYRMAKQSNVDQSQLDFEDTSSQQSFGSMATSRRESSSAYSTTLQVTQQPSSFHFAPSSVQGLNIPQQYPFVSQRRQVSNLPSDRAPDFPSTLTSMESSSSDFAEELKKPAGSNSGTGGYSCTYHGCTLRFETPAKLQKHKREGHRSSQPLVGSDSSNGAISLVLPRNSQAGPHKCERINPSTGKPCNVVFSRPYDLTRHEDTIHNRVGKKVRCQYCTEEKTFSRNDALTRHLRVVHPEIEFAGKMKRRGGHD